MNKRNNTSAQEAIARRWAWDFFAEGMNELPPIIRNSVNWLAVALHLEAEPRHLAGKDIEASINRVIDYLYEDERNDYLCREGGEDHIYLDLERIYRWLLKNPFRVGGVTR